MADASTLEELRAQIRAVETSGVSPSARCTQGSKKRHISSFDTHAQGKDEALSSAKASVSDKSEDAAFQKIVRMLAHSERASHTLFVRLTQDGFSDECAQAAVDRALRCGLVDDARFAEVLVRSRLSQEKGLCGIARELQDCGIDPSEVPAFVECEHDEATELKRALCALEHHHIRAKHKREAAYRFLLRRGFAVNLASVAARQWYEALSDMP